MARKPSASKPSSKKAKPGVGDKSGGDLKIRIITAALDEAAAVGWAHLSFEAVAARAGLTLGELLKHVPTKAHLLARFADYVDDASLSPVKAVDHSQSVKDRLFEILMRRFDTLQIHREGVKALLKAIQRDPGEALMLAARLSRSMAATLAAAGVTSHGLLGLAQTEAMKAVYASALRTWCSDDSTDMAKTMAALDKALGYAERAANFMKGRGRSRPAEAA